MSERQQLLFRVSVAGQDRANCYVHVRAPDIASALAEARSLGHDPLEAELVSDGPKNADAPSGAACHHCGYLLAGLPVRVKRRVQCPECGASNLPDPLSSQLVAEKYKRPSAGCLLLAILGIAFILFVLFVCGRMGSPLPHI